MHTDEHKREIAIYEATQLICALHGSLRSLGALVLPLAEQAAPASQEHAMIPQLFASLTTEEEELRECILCLLQEEMQDE